MSQSDTQVRPTLVVVTGPTASGKSALAVDLACALGTEIVSADSRQLYRGMEIGTAAPTPQEMARVRHHFVGILSPGDYYSAARYEEDVMALLPHLWEKSPYAVMCGGSMLYIDAVLRGLDELPVISDEVRARVAAISRAEALDMLRHLDPQGAERVDPANPRRVAHALEICLQAGQPASALLSGAKRPRLWRTVMMAIAHSREALFARINSRVEAMVEAGLEQELESLLPLRHTNALNTVGYKELIAMHDGLMDRETAIARIAKNTRVYAKKQLLWLSKQPDVCMLDPSQPLLPQALAAVPSDN